MVKLRKDDQEFSNKIGLDQGRESTVSKDGVFDIAKVKTMA